MSFVPGAPPRPQWESFSSPLSTPHFVLCGLLSFFFSFLFSLLFASLLFSFLFLFWKEQSLLLWTVSISFTLVNLADVFCSHVSDSWGKGPLPPPPVQSYHIISYTFWDLLSSNIPLPNVSLISPFLTACFSLAYKIVSSLLVFPKSIYLTLVLGNTKWEKESFCQISLSHPIYCYLSLNI